MSTPACLQAPRDIQLYMLSWAEDKDAIRYMRSCKSLKIFLCLYDLKRWVHPWSEAENSICRIRKLTLSSPEQAIPSQYPYVTHLTLNRQGLNLLYSLPVQWKIVHLELQASFNKPLPPLPESLAYLKLSSDFNQPLGKVLLSTSLKTLIFGAWFNRPVDGLLPESLTYLEFTGSFNQPINKLPSSLLHIFFTAAFNQSLDTLPEGIESIYLTNRQFSHSLERLPKTLKRIMLPWHYRGIPPNLPDSQWSSFAPIWREQNCD